MLTPEMDQRARDAYLTSVANGVTLTETLDDMGLLLTDAKRDEILREALVPILRGLQDETPQNVIRGFYGDSRPATAAEMFYAMVDWLTTAVEGKLKAGV